MTTLETVVHRLEPMDLAAMLCSRVCHDVISPVGAIINGLEVLEDDSDASMREVALELIKKSAGSASARLQFCRLAFGAAGSAGATIDTGDAETVARGLLETEKTKLDWRAERQFLPKNKVKLLLNLCQIGAATIHRGGVLSIETVGTGETVALTVRSAGPGAKLQAGYADLLRGEAVEARIDAHNIQPYFASLVAAEGAMRIDVEAQPDGFAFAARSLAALTPEPAPAPEPAAP